MESQKNRTQHVTRRVIELAAEKAGVEPATIGAQTHFINDLHFDSLDRVEYAMSLEDEFELSISDEEADELFTVGQVIAFILEHSSAVTDVA